MSSRIFEMREEPDAGVPFGSRGRGDAGKWTVFASLRRHIPVPPTPSLFHLRVCLLPSICFLIFLEALEQSFHSRH